MASALNIIILSNYIIIDKLEFMAGKFSRVLAICALLSNSQSNNLVRATFNTVSDGVVRIDLEKQYINYFNDV